MRPLPEDLTETVDHDQQVLLNEAFFPLAVLPRPEAIGSFSLAVGERDDGGVSFQLS